MNLKKFLVLTAIFSSLNSLPSSLSEAREQFYSLLQSRYNIKMYTIRGVEHKSISPFVISVKEKAATMNANHCYQLTLIKEDEILAALIYFKYVNQEL